MSIVSVAMSRSRFQQGIQEGIKNWSSRFWRAMHAFNKHPLWPVKCLDTTSNK